MDPSFLGIAISRKDGSNAEGIHLLWTAPYAAGYSAALMSYCRNSKRRANGLAFLILQRESNFR